MRNLGNSPASESRSSNINYSSANTILSTIFNIYFLRAGRSRPLSIRGKGKSYGAIKSLIYEIIIPRSRSCSPCCNPELICIINRYFFIYFNGAGIICCYITNLLVGKININRCSIIISIPYTLYIRLDSPFSNILS